MTKCMGLFKLAPKVRFHWCYIICYSFKSDPQIEEQSPNKDGEKAIQAPHYSRVMIISSGESCKANINTPIIHKYIAEEEDSNDSFSSVGNTSEEE